MPNFDAYTYEERSTPVTLLTEITAELICLSNVAEDKQVRLLMELLGRSKQCKRPILVTMPTRLPLPLLTKTTIIMVYSGSDFETVLSEISHKLVWSMTNVGRSFEAILSPLYGGCNAKGE